MTIRWTTDNATNTDVSRIQINKPKKITYGNKYLIIFSTIPSSNHQISFGCYFLSFN